MWTRSLGQLLIQSSWLFAFFWAEFVISSRVINTCLSLLFAFSSCITRLLPAALAMCCKICIFLAKLYHININIYIRVSENVYPQNDIFFIRLRTLNLCDLIRNIKQCANLKQEHNGLTLLLLLYLHVFKKAKLYAFVNLYFSNKFKQVSNDILQKKWCQEHNIVLGTVSHWTYYCREKKPEVLYKL